MQELLFVPFNMRITTNLHDASYTLNKLHRWDRLLIGQVVILRQLPRPSDEEAVVGAHSTVDHADVFGDLFDFGN